MRFSSDHMPALQERDINLLSHLYDNYSAALFSIILKRVFDERKAGELLEKTFKLIFIEMKNYNPDKCRVFTWMSGIANETLTTYQQDNLRFLSKRCISL